MNSSLEKASLPSSRFKTAFLTFPIKHRALNKVRLSPFLSILCLGVYGTAEATQTLGNLTAYLEPNNKVALQVDFSDKKQAIYLSNYTNGNGFQFRQLPIDTETPGADGGYSYNLATDLTCAENRTFELRLQANGVTFEWAPGPGESTYLHFDCNQIQEPTEPTPAPELTGRVANESVVLTWSTPQFTDTFRVDYGLSGEPLTLGPKTTTNNTLKVTDLINGTAYDFQVTAENDLGSTPSNLLTLIPEEVEEPIKLLVYSRTTGFRHGSIPAGNQMLKNLAQQQQWEVDVTEDPNHFNDLSDVDVVIFNNTTGDILNDQQEVLFKQWLENGGAFLGIHSAVDTENDWDWYHDQVLGGARFIGHPDGERRADLILEAPSSPFLNHVGGDGDRWSFFDEWYFWDVDLRAAPNLQVIARLDRTSYPTTQQPADADHPIIFTNQVENGHIYYTNQGHRNDTFSNNDFITQIKNAIVWLSNSNR